MEGNNRQQRERSRERSEERSPETSPMMVPATQPRSSMFSCCSWIASDEPVDVPASNVTQGEKRMVYHYTFNLTNSTSFPKCSVSE